MKIGFDAKRAVQNFTGLGNYSRFVINNLSKFYPDNTYELFSPISQVKDANLNSNSNITIYSKQGFRPTWRTYGITRDIKQEDIDVYHGLSNELPFRINKTGIKTVVTIHDLIFLRHPEFYPIIDRKIYNLKARYACHIADKIVAISECTKRDIIEYYGTDPNKIEVIYQGCFSVFGQKVSEERKVLVKKKYGLPDNFIVSIGSIEERKNILLIVKALKDVPDIHFVAIGKQRKYAEKVKQYVANNGLEDRVHIHSGIPLDDLPVILQSSKIFLYPSLYEGFGIPILEALSSGVPVIGATGSCLEEAGGPDSIYVNPFDVEQLAASIKLILNDDQLRERMITKGLVYSSGFSAEKCTSQLMNIYQSLYEAK